MNFEEGEVILIDKPIGWTSFDVVSKVRNSIRVKKVGHAGTLDPLATGLLILCTGKMTKKIEEYQAQEKEYEGEMIVGKTTPSYDGETEVDAQYETAHITETLLKEATKSFIGVISQYPPVYSAIKVNGVPMYKKARKGIEVEVKPREVHIMQFELTSFELPLIKFRVVCSKGTYIRSLVHDFGKALNSGAYMSALRRTRIGSYSLSEAYLLPTFVEKYKVSKPTN
jgi:tRNA pseudouridine55 synthase